MTPKTLDKYIAALKKKASAEGWSEAEYKKELNNYYFDFADQYNSGKITFAEMAAVQKKINNAEKNMALQGAKKPGAQPVVQTGMSSEEKNKLLHELQAKAINKEISKADADKLMDKVDELYGKSVTAEEAQKLLDHATALVKAGFDADAAFGAAESVAKQNKALGIGAQSTPQGMSHEEYIGLWEALNKKKKAGLIDKDEYHALGDKLDKAYKDKKTVADIEKEIGCDPGTLATDEKVIKLGKELKKVYGEAEKEMQAKLKEFMDEYGEDMKKLELDFINGTISAADLKWLQTQMMQQKIMKQKIDQLSGVMTNANKAALGMVNGEQVSVFAENANYQAYQLTQDTGVNLMFSVYDEHTAKKLIKEKPELLPRKEVNGKKDKAWNQKQIAGAVTQALIQGEAIPKLAKRIAVQTGETNMKAMLRYARTAMTSAQNSGRMEMLHQAQGMGIKCKKRWLATLDQRTRDTHAALDGAVVGVDDKFSNGLMYPGDPTGAAGEVYNCRCTLIYEYDGFPNDPTADQRLMYDEWDETVPVKKKDKNGKEYEVEKTIHHRESRMITDMNYDEWKAAKEGSKLNELNAAKVLLAEAQKAVVKANIKEDKKYEGIWKDPVTLADYPAKKDAIQAKRDYYTAEIQKFKEAQAAGYSWATDEKIKALQKNLKALNDFEKKGQLVDKRDKALAAVQDIYGQVGLGKQATAPNAAQIKAKKTVKKAAVDSGGESTGAAAKTPAGAAAGGTGTPFGPEAYTKERKDKALWTSDRKKVDNVMRDRTGEVWSNATQQEKDGIYEYTQSFHKYNEPLRGIEYGTNRFLGVGNTDLDARGNGKRLNAMTDIIDKCWYDHDQWFQRGCGWGGMDKFLQCSESLLRSGTQKQLQDELLGKTITEYGFMSMGSAKGKGFSGNILFNIYAPAGTKMMYAEPFSAFSGSREHMNWDGKSKQANFGSEFETIMQQGTQFRVSKVEKSGGQLYVDIEVIGQDKQQRWNGRK